MANSTFARRRAAVGAILAGLAALAAHGCHRGEAGKKAAEEISAGARGAFSSFPLAAPTLPEGVAPGSAEAWSALGQQIQTLRGQVPGSEVVGGIPDYAVQSAAFGLYEASVAFVGTDFADAAAANDAATRLHAAAQQMAFAIEEALLRLEREGEPHPGGPGWPPPGGPHGGPGGGPYGGPGGGPYGGPGGGPYGGPGGGHGGGPGGGHGGGPGGGGPGGGGPGGGGPGGGGTGGGAHGGPGGGGPHGHATVHGPGKLGAYGYCPTYPYWIACPCLADVDWVSAGSELPQWASWWADLRYWWSLSGC